MTEFKTESFEADAGIWKLRSKIDEFIQVREVKEIISLNVTSVMIEQSYERMLERLRVTVHVNVERIKEYVCTPAHML